MGALNMVVASDLSSMLLTFYVRGKMMAQTIKEKPFLAWLRKNKKPFPGGNNNLISIGVQGQYMSDTPGFFSGYSEDSALPFAQAMNALRCQYPWRECSAGLEITWTELKKDGITVNDDAKTSEHSETDLIRLADVLQNRLDDYGESWARSLNYMFWKDGTQDALQVPGIQSIIYPGGAGTTTGGLSRATYPWWYNRAVSNITASATDQTLCKTMRREKRQLKVFGGKPDAIFSGSAFIEALELEVSEKGYYTMTGFNSSDKTDFGIDDISIKGIGTFVYDPTLDELGQSKLSYILDSRRVKWRPMQMEEDKTLKPVRPYNVAVFLHNMTTTGGLVCDQLNANGVYSVA